MYASAPINKPAAHTRKSAIANGPAARWSSRRGPSPVALVDGKGSGVCPNTLREPTGSRVEARYSSIGDGVTGVSLFGSSLFAGLCELATKHMHAR
jgi:hypothetical protein